MSAREAILNAVRGALGHRSVDPAALRREADALLEGIYAETWGNVRDQLADPQERDRYPFDLPVFIPPIEAEETVPICLTAVEAFQHLWTSLYGDDPVKGWAANPTVIATSFEPVT